MIDSDWQPEGALQRALHTLDRFSWGLGGVFILLCNVCLLIMLLLTAATIVMRPFGLSSYWIWPWTMVFFVWLSFFGFFAVHVRLKDIRIDFIAVRMGRIGMPATRLLGDLSALAVCGVLMSQLPKVMETSNGWVDGAIFPGGEELARQALSIPLFISAGLIILSSLLNIAKFAAGIPETLTVHPEI